MLSMTTLKRYQQEEPRFPAITVATWPGMYSIFCWSLVQQKDK